GARIQYAIVSEHSVIGKNAVIGARPEEIEDKDKWGVTVIGDNCVIAADTVVPPKAMIDSEEVQ
ncbi:MAG TPA: glucose-1-phosphate adenylyltransferase, partial [Ruminococcaceae bacterium]|nr:glucose-1-phosphate adenylyltransferase [Oscillospiraceae bacterium]